MFLWRALLLLWGGGSDGSGPDIATGTWGDVATTGAWADRSVTGAWADVTVTGLWADY